MGPVSFCIRQDGVSFPKKEFSMETSPFNPQFLYDQVVEYVFSGNAPSSLQRKPKDELAQVRELASAMLESDGAILTPLLQCVNSINATFASFVWPEMKKAGLQNRLEIKFSLPPFEGSDDPALDDQFTFQLSHLESPPDINSVAEKNVLIDSVYLPAFDEEFVLENQSRIQSIYNACKNTLAPYLDLMDASQSSQCLVQVSAIVCALTNMVTIRRTGCGCICSGIVEKSDLFELKFEVKGSWNHQPYFEGASEHEEIQAQVDAMDSVVEDPRATAVDFKRCAVALRRLLNSTPELFGADGPYYDLIYTLRGKSVDIEDARLALSNVSGFTRAVALYKTRKNSCRYKH